MKRILLITLVALVLLMGGCGFEGDPMLDDAYTRNVYPGEDGTYNIGRGGLAYAEGYFDALYVDGEAVGGGVLSAPAYGEIYITTPIATTCTVAGTFYLVAGTTTSDELQDFTATNERLTYNGAGTRVFLVAAAISVSSDANNVVLSTKVYKNGAAHAASLIQRKITVANDIGAQAIATLVTLTTNDYIEIYIACDNAGTAITFECMSLTATAVD